MIFIKKDLPLPPGNLGLPFTRDEHQITVADLTSLYVKKEPDLELLQRAVNVKALPASWRDYFQKQIEKLSSLNSSDSH